MAIRSGLQRGAQANRRRNNGHNAAMQNRINNARNRLRNRPVSTPEEAQEQEEMDKQLASQERQLTNNRRQESSSSSSSGDLQSKVNNLVNGGGSSSHEEEGSFSGTIKNRVKKKIIKYAVIALLVILAFAVVAFIILSPLLSIASIVDDKVDYSCEKINVRRLIKHDPGYVMQDDEGLWCDDEQDCEEPLENDYVYVYKKVGEKGDGYVEYDFEDYVSMVVEAEVGGLSKWDEVLKALAVAARSFGMAKTSPMLDCKIKSSDKTQTTKDLGNVTDKVKKAVKATKGEVLTKDGSVYLPMYDAFACIDTVNENGIDYYVINQPEPDHLKIPFSWVSENGIYLGEDWTLCDGELHGHHGQGMSQDGAAYLADVYNYDYHEILFYFYSRYLDED